MQFKFKNFSQLVTDQTNAIRAKCAEFMDFSIGSILLSWVESNSFVTLWLQEQLVKLLSIIRASTIADDDRVSLDSWFKDFGYARLDGVAATGDLTISRKNPTAEGVLPLNAEFSKENSTIIYGPVADLKNSYYHEDTKTYRLPIGTGGISIPVECKVIGQQGNTDANTITVLKTSLIGIETCTNPKAFISGRDAATNAQAKNDFIQFLLNYAKANEGTFEYTLNNNANIKRYRIIPWYNPILSIQIGEVQIYISGDSPELPSGIIPAIAEEINAIKAAGIFISLLPAIVLPLDILIEVQLTTSDKESVKQSIETAIKSYVMSIKIGDKVPYNYLYKVIYASDSRIKEVTKLLLQNKQEDLQLAANQVAFPGKIEIFFVERK